MIHDYISLSQTRFFSNRLEGSCAKACKPWKNKNAPVTHNVVDSANFLSNPHNLITKVLGVGEDNVQV